MIAAISFALLVVLALGWVLAPMMLGTAGSAPLQCSRCGAESAEGMTYCARCGERLHPGAR